MAYIGVQPADAYTSFAVQHFTTSATTSYTLDNPVANENEIALFINNVRQEPGSSYAYTASGTTLTLSAATSASDTMYCVFIGKAVQTVTPNLNPVTIDGATVATFNRTTSDGDIIEIQKDGTSVGVLGVNSSDNLYLAGGSGGTKGIYFSASNMSPATTGGATLDNGVDIGASGVRWKDLYLGGSVYLGGTGSANALDDYEEGSFTPSLDIETGANITVNTIQGYYRKIGNLVAFTIFCDWDKTAGSANMKFTGLPFTSSNQTNLTRQAVEWQQGAYTDQGALTGGAVFASGTDVYFVDSKYGSFNSNFDTNNAGRIANTTGIRSFVNGTYFTT